MKFDTLVPISTARDSSAGVGTANVKTLAIPDGTSAVLLTVETTSARVTFDGTDPGAASAPSHVLPKDAAPVMVPVGSGATLSWCAATAAASVLQATFLG